MSEKFAPGRGALSLPDRPPPCRVVVLVSGHGSNLQSILDRAQTPACAFEVVGVISNEPTAYGLKRAYQAGVANDIVHHLDFESRDAFDRALGAAIDRYRPDLVVLAGFMRILGARLVGAYTGRMMNIHPSLLPEYRGLNTHTRVLADGARSHGATVHFVVPTLDAGPIILQGRVLVTPDDTPESLAERVHQTEHQIYSTAITWFAQDRLSLVGQCACLDGLPITP